MLGMPASYLQPSGVYRSRSSKVVPRDFRLAHVNVHSSPSTEFMDTLHEFGHVLYVLRQESRIIREGQDISFHPTRVLDSAALLFKPSEHNIDY